MFPLKVTSRSEVSWGEMQLFAEGPRREWAFFRRGGGVN